MTTIAFIGFGELGQRFVQDLARGGGVALSVHDIAFADPVRGPKLRRLAVEAGAIAAESHEEACRGAAIVISAVTADQAVMAAQQTAPGLVAGQTYVDLNSVSPSTKRQVAEALSASGVGFVEFAVMAPIGGPGLAVPILAGGKPAAEVAARLNPLGMRITAIADEIGVASATKLCRSIVIKGMEAIMVDLALAGGRTGVLPAVLASLDASYPGMDWAELVRVMPTRVDRHGVRRAAEMREVARMLEELGLAGSLAEAIADRHQSYAGKGEGVAAASKIAVAAE